VSAGKLGLAAGLLHRSHGGAVLRLAPAWSGVLILNYHRIGYAESAPFFRDAISATPHEFDAQLAFLARNADVVAGADLPEVLRAGRGRHVMITFDDGYRDNYEIALPLLKLHGLAATFFLCTGLLDGRGLA
jgi:peptidoglycan/xylan/chitin deacetylase (PgdA/CDA1 family)